MRAIQGPLALAVLAVAATVLARVQAQMAPQILAAAAVAVVA